MAKKTVASLKKADSRGIVKVIKPVRSDKTGAYTFREEMLPVETANDFFKSDK